MALVLALAGFCLPASASAATDTFTNANGIGIPDSGAASPYPSTISVGGLNTPVLDVNATLTGLSHPCQPDLDILLQGPAGQNTLLLSDSGECPQGDRGFVNPLATITLDDEAPTTYPCDSSPSGTFKPTDDACLQFRTVGDFFPPPGPGFGAFPASLTVFDGTNPNGTWNLYVVDQFGNVRGDPITGTMASWSVTITTPDPAAAAAPSTSPAHTCFGQTATKEGTTGDDVIQGTPGPDVITAHAGDDRIRGLEQNDVVCAGRGDDTAFGGPGDDVLIGGQGDDNLNGGTGNDRLFGGTPGNSQGGSGDDNCRGGAGSDKNRGCESGSP